MSTARLPPTSRDLERDDHVPRAMWAFLLKIEPGAWPPREAMHGR